MQHSSTIFAERAQRPDRPARSCLSTTFALVDIDGDGQQEFAALANSADGPLSFWHCDKATHIWTPMPSLNLPPGTNWTVSFPLQSANPDAYFGCIRYVMLAGSQHVFVRAADGVYVYS